MNAFEKLCDSITENIPGVLQQFNLVTEREPWTHLPPDCRVAFLGELILLASTLALRAPDDGELCNRLLRCAARHGETRLRQGIPDGSVFQEICMVRDSLWHYLRSGYTGETRVATQAILRVDRALSLASMASIRGYYRPAFEERGTWPSVIDQLARDWDGRPPIEVVHPVAGVPA